MNSGVRQVYKFIVQVEISAMNKYDYVFNEEWYKKLINRDGQPMPSGVFDNPILLHFVLLRNLSQLNF